MLLLILLHNKLNTSTVSSLDLLSAFFWLIVIFVIANYRSAKIDDEIKKYYFWNVGYKLFFSLLFTLVYIVYYKGGDTTAYWDGARSLHNLFYKSPAMYLEEMLNTPSDVMKLRHFDSQTGFPPGWIYREPEGWFVSKVASIISFITFKSYIAATFLFSFIAANASWKIFELVYSLKTNKTGIAAFALLFIPSVNFWCTGISKDTLMFISIFYLLFYFFDFFLNKKAFLIKHVFWICIFIILINNIRPFLIAALLAPMLISYGTRLTKKYETNLLAKLLLRSFYIITGFGLLFVFMGSDFAGEMLSEASIVQQDFIQNETYTGKRYEINTTDATPLGLLKAFPVSVLFGFYRPLITESLSPTLFLNGLESTYLIFLTFVFVFGGRFKERVSSIRKSEFLIFAFIFAVFISFMAGFTSVLFGVLVRIRAPLLPFLFLVLTTVSITTEKEKEESIKGKKL